MKKDPRKVADYLLDHTWKQTATHFQISEMTISRYLKHLELSDIIKSNVYINKLKRGFNKLLRKKLYDMSATELKVIYALLTGKYTSMTKDRYILRIKKIVGVNNWKTKI